LEKIDLNDSFEKHFELIYLHDVVRIIFVQSFTLGLIRQGYTLYG